jgi:hypothetical protein
MSEVLLKPTILPESPEVVTLVDDQTAIFSPQFGRGWTQRNSFGDPRWRLKRRYKAMRAADAAGLIATLQSAQGAFNSVRATPAWARRGSFPCPELLANNDFSNGVTGWTVTGVLTVADQVARITAATGGLLEAYQSVSPVANAPYVLRGMTTEGNLSASMAIGPFLAGGSYGNGYSTSRGLISVVNEVPGGNLSYGFSGQTASIAGTYYEIPWMSMTRCARVDYGQNLLLQSQTLDVGPWTTSANSTVIANQGTAPDGTVTADYLREGNTANIEHYATQGAAVTGSAQDCTFSCAVATVTRGWAVVRMIETFGLHQAYAFVNLSTGALGTVTVSGANWSNARAVVVSQGSGWWRVSITARKTSAATGINCYISSATADNSFTYVGVAAQNAISMWGAQFYNTASPTRYYAATTSSISTGSAPSGNTLNVKGLPASTNGLLLAGDFFEVNNELKQCTAPLNSDASGLGTLQFRPSLHTPPVDNEAVIISNPLGRFMLSGGAEWQMMYGNYLDTDVTLDEVYS